MRIINIMPMMQINQQNKNSLNKQNVSFERITSAPTFRKIKRLPIVGDLISFFKTVLRRAERALAEESQIRGLEEEVEVVKDLNPIAVRETRYEGGKVTEQVKVRLKDASTMVYERNKK